MIFSKEYPTGVIVRNCKVGGVFLLTILSVFTASAQLSPGLLQQYLLDNLDRKELKINYQKEISDFYLRISYQPVWMQQEKTINLACLLDNLSSSPKWGLREKDYQYSFISAFKNGTLRLQNLGDSLKAEVLISDAAIHFYSDIAYGNAQPSLGYMGIKYAPDCCKIPASLAEYILENKIHFLASFLSPPMEEVKVIGDKINWITEVMEKKDFSEKIIISKKVNTENKSLWQKLYQLGILDSTNEDTSEKSLKQKIEEAQLMFNLSANGELNQEIIRECNVLLKVRLDQLALSINYYRWLSCLTQNQSVIVVNIPAAYLKVYRDNKVILEMRIVVGKPSTPTFTLASTVNEVILYPFWHVPLSIAAKELLPAIKRDPSFLDANNYQVLNKSGQTIDPHSVNWYALSRNYFPYTIRQGTGCDNALGLLKLNFHNPFGAYLHDTPDKNLFKRRRRFYSHGCMRMEKPMELGHLVLNNNHLAIDTLTEAGCLKNQSPITVPADVKMPVIVWYNTSGVDSSGHVVFFEDVYKRKNWSK